MTEEMKKSVWCPGCSRHVDGVCHQFHCAIGPNGMAATIEDKNNLLQQRIIERDYHLKMARLLSSLIGDHELYKNGDLDAPEQIKDRNGHVVLSMCRKCGKAEIELSDACPH